MVAVVLAVLGAWAFLARSLPSYAGALEIPGLHGPVEVFRDEWGVPHIVAGDDHDLYLATGFVQAQDRLFQMDLVRRVAWGRLAEVFGEDALPTDREHRVAGFGRAARDILPRLHPETRAVLDAYAEGVNAFIETTRALPFEFTVLGLRPEPWTAEDTVAIGRFIGWTLGERVDPEVLTLEVRRRLGDAVAAWFCPPAPPPWIDPIAPDPPCPDPADCVEPAPLPFPPLPDEVRRGRADPGRPHGTGSSVGSNNWAVAPSRSTTGRALLASDPHLMITMPSFWHLVHQTAPGVDVIGAAPAGVPVVLIGRNRHIAWGLTNVGADVQDLYLLKESPDGGGTLGPGGRVEPYRFSDEVIRVKEGSGFREEPLRVRLTRHGPVLEEDAGAPGWVLALRWTGHDPSDEVRAFHLVNRARDFAQFREGVRHFGVSAQNFVYADAEGRIGYQLGGRIPVRRGWDGRGPAPGDDPGHEWLGDVLFEDLPWFLDPPSGVIATANQTPVGPRYPYPVTTSPDPPFRALRQEVLFGGARRLSPDDMAAAQADVVSEQARGFVPLLAAATEASGPLGEREQAALDLVRSWDLRYAVESAAPLIVQETYNRALRRTFSDELGAWYGRFAAIRFLASVALDRALLDRDHPAFDDRTTPTRETRDDVLAAAFREAVEALSHRHGDDPAGWRWGDEHRLALRHPFSRIPVLGRLFVTGPFPVDGCGFTLDATSSSLGEDHAVTVGPSYRQIVDFSRPDRVLVAMTSGQSGHVLSPHYDDLTALWLDNRYADLTMDPAAVRALPDRLTLRPAGRAGGAGPWFARRTNLVR